jgi:hypothetical protein
MKRAVRTLLRLIAAGLLIFGALEIGLELEHHQLQIRNHVEPAETNIWRYVIGAVLVVAGLILFAASASLAEQLTDDFEE